MPTEPSSPLDPSLRPLIVVDRAMGELRRGGVVAIRGADGLAFALAAEAVTECALARLDALGGSGFVLIVTGRRAQVLGARDGDAGSDAVIIRAETGLDAGTIVALADPCGREGALAGVPGLRAEPADGEAALAAVTLTKLARLLPAAVLAFGSGPAPAEMLTLDATDILSYQLNAARTLTMVSEARVPLAEAENTRIIAFRPSDGGVEHLALIIGTPDTGAPVLTRLHSECFTGDLLGSLRCDCGDQLRGAIGEIAKAGSGVLLYLAQEGRGIGLVNKLRAYRLQDEGFDTLDANLQLGFDDDERIYLPAASMLALLGISRVRLMTNNPAKVEALARHGVEVCERVAHVFPANDHNQAYLRTKASRGGHLF